MPHEWNSKLVVTKDELIPVFFSDYNHLDVTIRRYKDKPYGIKKLQGGGNGRELLIDFDSLDIEIRNVLGDPRKVTGNNWLDKYYVLDSEAVRFYSAFRFDDNDGLDTEHIEEYAVNASLLKACGLLKVARERERISKRGSLRGVNTTIWRDAMNFKEIMKLKHGVVHTLPANERRFLEAWKHFEGMGYTSLISKKYKNANAKKVDEQTEKLLNDMFAGVTSKPTPTQIARQYTMFLAGQLDVIDNSTGEVYEASGYPNISQSTIMNYLGKWDNRIGTFAKRSGNRQVYMNQFKVTHSLDKPQFAGSLLSIDDRNPPFVMPNGKRVWFYIALDVASEAWVCWVHGRTKEGIITDFYRQLLRTYSQLGFNVSFELECESSLNSSFTKTFLADGAMFGKVRMEANNSTGKIIEPYFRQLRYSHEKDLEGWQARPFARSEPNQAKTDKKITLEYDEIVAQTEEVMRQWNNSPHPSGCGLTRWEYYLQRQHSKTVPIHWESILPQLGRRTKTSCNVGKVWLDGKEFFLAESGADTIALGDSLITLMKKVEGENLVVYWLDDEDGNVIKALAYIQDRYVCDLVRKPKYNRATIERTAQCERNYSLVSSYSMTIASFGTRQKNSIDKVTLMKVEKQPIVAHKTIMLPPIDEQDEEEDFKITYKQSLLDRY